MSDDILSEFKDVDGLKEIIEGIKDISKSEIHGMLYKASKNKDRWRLELDGKADELLQVKYANKIFKNPIIYRPPKTDVIIGRNFYSAFLLINWIYWIHDPEANDTGYDKQSKILERIMILLDDFDRIESFKEPNEEFYKKLKNTKWDEEGKALSKKLNDIHYHVDFEIWGIMRVRNVNLTEDRTLIFLAACNAVHRNSDRILPEDIVKAFKTYLKLLNTDITKVGMLHEGLNQVSPESTVRSIETSDDESIKEKIPEIVKDNPQNSNINQGNFCPDCGSSNVAHAKYCAFCGSKLGL